MRGEQPAHEPGQRFAIPRRQALEHRQDVGFEASRGLRHEHPAVVGKADQRGPPVRDRRNAHDQAAPLSAVNQAGNAGLVESQDPRQVVHGRGAVPKYPKQARLLGAGRDPGRLQALTAVGADDIVQLTDDSEATGNALAAAAADTDIVIDYLWGKPAQQAITALLTARSDRGRALNWIQIGAVAGPTIELPSVALRSANLRVQGSGQGAVGPADYLAELPSLVDAISNGAITVKANTVPLADVEQAWARTEAPGERTVLVP